tara:strand:+ start:28 stop:375 length:348 start_codon:yes stop_codon:yes gene_type:complete
MRITIQQTVDLGELPLKADQILKEHAAQLSTILNILETLDCTNPEKFVEQLDFVRRKMFIVDSGLEECSMLMNGYITATTQNDEIHGAPLNEDAQHTMTEVVEKLSDLKEKLNEQ